MNALEIRELQAFLMLVKTGSFSGAAHQLGVSQPAVSGQILKLEQIIGYPLFYRSAEGTTITEQGQALVPLIEDIVKEYADLRRRAAYWNRSQTKLVKIWADASTAAQWARSHSREVVQGKARDDWKDLEPDDDWLSALRNLDVDVVLAGSFLKAGEAPGIKTLALRQERGMTIAWNPAYYGFRLDSFSLADVIASTCILPAPTLAIGFRDFLTNWCESTYGYSFGEVIECRSEAEVVNICKLGLGVMVFPGDVEVRLKLREAGLKTLKTFRIVLPKAFTFGIRYRADEQNPQILNAVARLAEKLGKQD